MQGSKRLRFIVLKSASLLTKQPAYGDCGKADIEERCPQLAGTAWAVQFPGIAR
jgi:hypothetical protein